jgi:hypothetical protein
MYFTRNSRQTTQCAVDQRRRARDRAEMLNQVRSLDRGVLERSLDILGWLLTLVRDLLSQALLVAVFIKIRNVRRRT